MQNIDPLEIANILATELWCQQVYLLPPYCACVLGYARLDPHPERIDSSWLLRHLAVAPFQSVTTVE